MCGQIKGVDMLLFHKKMLFYEFGTLNSFVRGTENDFLKLCFDYHLWCNERNFTFIVTRIKVIQKLNLG